MTTSSSTGNAIDGSRSFDFYTQQAEEATKRGDKEAAAYFNTLAAIAKALYEEALNNVKAGLAMLRKSSDIVT